MLLPHSQQHIRKEDSSCNIDAWQNRVRIDEKRQWEVSDGSHPHEWPPPPPPRALQGEEGDWLKI
jgi:hypothetical protein